MLRMKKTLSNMLMMSLLLMVIVPVQGRENVKERKRTTAAAPRNSFKAEAGDCLTPAYRWRPVVEPKRCPLSGA